MKKDNYLVYTNKVTNEIGHIINIRHIESVSLYPGLDSEYKAIIRGVSGQTYNVPDTVEHLCKLMEINQE